MCEAARRPVRGGGGAGLPAAVPRHRLPVRQPGLRRRLLQPQGQLQHWLSGYTIQGDYYNHPRQVEHVKFSDFCGKYRVPLLQYLCSAHCSVSMQDSGREQDRGQLPLSRVLLG